MQIISFGRLVLPFSLELNARFKIIILYMYLGIKLWDLQVCDRASDHAMKYFTFTLGN